MAFCRQDSPGRAESALLPASEETLLRFCAWLSDRLLHSSIKVYLSAVRSLHIDLGLADPLSGRLRLRRMLRGIHRVQGSPSPKRLPITGNLLGTIRQSLDVSLPDHVMFWAACCIGFFGFLRAGEFTVNAPFDPRLHLTLDDFQLDSLSAPTIIRLRIKCSKTDPFRQGCFIYLGQGRPPLCPVAASLAYLNLRGPEPGPLFRYANGSPLSRQQLSTSLQSILRSAGVSGQYSGHSFRIGAATTAAQRGIPDHLIKTLGRWSSDAYQTYIRTPVATICGAAQLMA